MLQVIQYQKTGEITVEELPVPKVKEGFVLVKNLYSLISAGTERSSVETAQASIIGKAKSRPDLVKQVADNIKREGLLSTYQKVKNRLDNYKELGYSSAGIVVESRVEGFNKGDRVACAGAGYASHAEVICVPKNLVAKVPDNVSFNEAAFTTVGSIALQGVRQTNVKIGEYVAVIGLGLIGLITVQLLKASGCSVIGLDINSNNFDLAKSFGCDDCMSSQYSSLRQIESFTKGNGVDSVIITASTKSNEPVELSISMARKKARIVIVGAVKMDFPRSGFYEKELEVVQSCSYGPGRYDQSYEEKGFDYPIGYVRWTENRNMYAILEFLSQRKLTFNPLITHIFKLEDALKAYDIITGKLNEKYLGILIEYQKEIPTLDFKQKINRKSSNTNSTKSDLVIGFIGAGNFAQSYLIPPIKKLDIRLKMVATSKPINSKSVAEKFDFENFTTNASEICHDKEINTVIIATHHNSHAGYVIDALKSGKNVFVEKPLAVNKEELKIIEDLYLNSEVKLMTGFNRRFSEPFCEIKNFFNNRREPLVLNYRINAGFVPKAHWYQDKSNGGRIIGEVCHFIDALQFFTNSEPLRVYAECIASNNVQITNEDNVNITIAFKDGSLGTISYLANGDASLPKEYLEIFGENSIAIMDNFKVLRLMRNRKSKIKKFNGDKGHTNEIRSFINSIKDDKESPISFYSMYLTTLTTFSVLDSIKEKRVIEIER